MPTGNSLNSVYAGVATPAASQQEPAQASSIAQRVANSVFSKWGLGLCLLSVIAVGVRFGVTSPIAAVAGVGLMLFTAVNWIRSGLIDPRPTAAPAPAAVSPVSVSAAPPSATQRQQLLQGPKASPLFEQLAQCNSNRESLAALQKSANISVANVESLFEHAAENGNTAITKLICENFKSLKITTKSFELALFFASREGQDAIVTQLLKVLPSNATLETIHRAVVLTKTPELGMQILDTFFVKSPNLTSPTQTTLDELFEYAWKHGPHRDFQDPLPFPTAMQHNPLNTIKALFNMNISQEAAKKALESLHLWKTFQYDACTLLLSKKSIDDPDFLLRILNNCQNHAIKNAIRHYAEHHTINLYPLLSGS